MIQRVRIQNFKSIRDVTVDLSPVTVLVGKSGAGKSNFVESLRFLRDILTSQPGSDAFQKTWPNVRPATTRTTTTSFEIEFSIEGISEKFRYVLTLAEIGNKRRVTEERLELGERILFHQSGTNEKGGQVTYRWVIEPSVVETPKPGEIVLGRIPSISEIVIAFTALTSGIGCYVFPDTVLSGRQQLEASAGLDDGATNYLSALKEIVSNLQDLSVRKSIVSALQRVNQSVTSVELNDIRKPSHVVVGHKFNDKTLTLQLSQESDGFRRFYAHLLALYQRPPKQTLIFEHPEDGIHPGALSLLAEEFKAASQTGRGQVILTTHNPMLLDHFDVDQIRVVELVGFETQIGFVSSEQREAILEKLLDAGELLTVDPARIESSAPEPAGA